MIMFSAYYLSAQQAYVGMLMVDIKQMRCTKQMVSRETPEFMLTLQVFSLTCSTQFKCRAHLSVI